MSQLNKRDAELSEAMGLQGRVPPFIELLGVIFEPTEGDGICLKLAMREELSLSHHGGALHGGVISALVDIIGGSVVAWKLKDEIKTLPLEEQAKRMSRVSTIDLRIDYLRPGKGKMFTATGYILRYGKKVAVTRMELHNEEQVLIAAGAGSYTVG
ncbi:MAG: thioesterase family protein [Dehalococcoidia bacterium]|nr:thioesterase family protein [Dehalococcoidia bacterium]